MHQSMWMFVCNLHQKLVAFSWKKKLSVWNRKNDTVASSEIIFSLWKKKVKHDRASISFCFLSPSLFLSLSHLALSLSLCFFPHFRFHLLACCVIQIGITCFTDLVYFGLLTSLPLLIIAVWLFIIFGAGLPFWSIFFLTTFIVIWTISYMLIASSNNTNSINSTWKNGENKSHIFLFWPQKCFWRIDNNWSLAQINGWGGCLKLKDFIFL